VTIPRESDELFSAPHTNDQDWRWVQEQCLHFLTFPEVWVRRNAATCLGLLAVFRKKLDFARILPALERAA